MRFKMTAKSVLVRPQGLRSRARAPTCLPTCLSPCYVTGNTYCKSTVYTVSRSLIIS